MFITNIWINCLKNKESYFFYRNREIVINYIYLGLTYLEVAASAQTNKKACVEYLLKSGAGYHEAYTGKS